MKGYEFIIGLNKGLSKGLERKRLNVQSKTAKSQGNGICNYL